MRQIRPHQYPPVDYDPERCQHARHLACIRHNRTTDFLCRNEWYRKWRVLCHHAYCDRPDDRTWSSGCRDGNGNHELNWRISHGDSHRRNAHRRYRHRKGTHCRAIEGRHILCWWCRIGLRYVCACCKVENGHRVDQENVMTKRCAADEEAFGTFIISISTNQVAGDLDSGPSDVALSKAYCIVSFISYSEDAN